MIPGMGDHRLDLREHLQNAVLHLLHGVRNSIRPMHLDRAGIFIHSELVPLQIEFVVCQARSWMTCVLALGADVEIARVIPSADIQSRNVLAGLEGGVECWRRIQ